ncbi:hypothetical protein ACFCYB_32610 [Streptomyces sp. NPDC056309]
MVTRTRRVSDRSWPFDQDALQAEAAVDGWYALLTTLTPEQADHR